MKTVTEQHLPLLWPVAAWVSGLALSRGDMLSPVASALLLAFLFLLLLLLRRKIPALLLIVAALWGSADLLLDARSVAVHQSWLNNPVSSSAVIHRIQRSPTHLRLQLQQIRRDDSQTLNGSALLYIYRGHTDKPQPRLQAGDRIHFRAVWHRPHNQLNPGRFDYQAWCFDQHIALLGSVRGDLQRLAREPSLLERGRERIATALNLLPADRAGVLRALLLADRSQLPVAVNNAFAATGTAHLLAISGMHMGMAAAWGMALIWWLLTRKEKWIVCLPVRTLAMLAGLLTAAAYALIAGWPLPAVRAAIMLAAAVLALSLSARNAPMNILLAALALILLCDPTAIGSLSLWLSFTATAALLLWARHSQLSTKTETTPENSGHFLRLLQAGKALLWISLIATLATLPITLAAFGRLPVYSLPANLLLVPLYGLLVMPTALLAELAALLHLEWLAGLLMQAAGLAVQGGAELLAWIMTWPAASTWAVLPPLWLGGAYITAMLLVIRLFIRQRHIPAAALALLIVTIYTGAVLHERNIDKPLWLVWDVGQGAASTLLLPDNKVIVVDVPGRANSRFNGGTSVAAGLRTLGLTHIDLLILSHVQSDHLGGALSLLKAVNSTGERWLPDVADAHRDARVAAIVAQARLQGTAVHGL
ncbi:MAG: DNA internalization-related competence protein ComEC/Rec2, partial [Mariprofundus sp.]